MSAMGRFRWSAIASCLVVSTACGKSEAPAPSPALRAEAQELFASRCTACHGAQGAGDGPASAGLSPKPAKFSDSSWQKSVTDQHIEKVIQQGGAAVGKSAAMPGNPDLADKPELLAAVRYHVRSLKR